MRTPMKGFPDFTSLSDEKIREFENLAQQMILAYKYCDEEKVRVLTEVWKQLSVERADREMQKPFEVEESAPCAVHKIKVVKRIKR